MYQIICSRISWKGLTPGSNISKTHKQMHINFLSRWQFTSWKEEVDCLKWKTIKATVKIAARGKSQLARHNFIKVRLDSRKLEVQKRQILFSKHKWVYSILSYRSYSTSSYCACLHTERFSLSTVIKFSHINC